MASRADVPDPAIPPPPRPGNEPMPPSAAAAPAVPGAYPGVGATGPYSGGTPYESVGTVAGLHIPGASTMYSLLGLLMMASAVLALVAPYWLTDTFFRGKYPHPDVLFEELWRILAASLLMGAAACYGLKVASDRRMLGDFTVQRLQLGLFWFALVAVLIHVVHLLFTKTLTLWGLLIGAVVMGTTLLLPTVHLSMSGGFGLQAMVEGFRRCAGNMFAPRRVTAAVFLYALLTLTFALAGLMYLFLPKLSMKWVFGYALAGHKGKGAIFLWQWIGAGLLFLFTSSTYTLQENAIAGLLHSTICRTLNVGLLVAGLFHVLELGTLLVDGGVQGRWLLPVLFAHWVLVLVASILGLSASVPAAPAYEYEPLMADRTAV